MPFARHLQVATMDFIIGDTGPLPREAALLAIAAAMTADGHHDETANALSWVLREHPDAEQVREAIVQTHLFCGWPRTLNALDAMRKGAEKAGVDISKLRTAPLEHELDRETALKRGDALWQNIYGANAARVADNAHALSPDLALWSRQHGYGAVMARPGLDALTREFCTVAALIIMDVPPQLKGHVQGALNLGATKEQMWELLAVVRKLFEADRLLNAALKTFESVLGKKASDLSLEEERRYQW